MDLLFKIHFLLSLCIFSLSLAKIAPSDSDRSSSPSPGDSPFTSDTRVAFIDVCIIHPAQDPAPHVPVHSTCVCRAPDTMGLNNFTAEWVDKGTGKVIASGKKFVTLVITSEYVAKNTSIICRRKLNEFVSAGVQLPPILDAPMKVDVSLDSSDGYLHATKDYPTTFTFTCSLPKRDVFPEPYARAMITMYGEDKKVDALAIYSFNKSLTNDLFVFYFRHQVMRPGRLFVKCIVTTSITGALTFIGLQTIEVLDTIPNTSTSTPLDDNVLAEQSSPSPGDFPFTSDTRVVYIDVCIIHPAQDPAPHVPVHSTCVCRAPDSMGLKNFTAEWVDQGTGKVIASGNKFVPLVITPEYLETSMAVDVSFDNTNRNFYTSKDCPATVTFTCSLPKKNVFPEPYARAMVTLYGENKEVEAVKVEYFNKNWTSDPFVFYFSYGVTRPGRLFVKCTVTTSIKWSFTYIGLQYVEVLERSMKPIITTENYLSTIHNDFITLNMASTVKLWCLVPNPWDNQEKYEVLFQCSKNKHQNKTSSGDVSLQFVVSEDLNQTFCHCIVQYFNCGQNRISATRLTVDGTTTTNKEPPKKGGEKNNLTTVEVLPTSDKLSQSTTTNTTSSEDASQSFDTSLIIMIAAIMGGAIILAALIFYCIGFKAGSKRTGKHSLKSEPSIMFKATPAYEDIPERGPLREAYTESTLTKGPKPDLIYSSSQIGYLDPLDIGVQQPRLDKLAIVDNHYERPSHSQVIRNYEDMLDQPEGNNTQLQPPKRNVVEDDIYERPSSSSEIINSYEDTLGQNKGKKTEKIEPPVRKISEQNVYESQSSSDILNRYADTSNQHPGKRVDPFQSTKMETAEDNIYERPSSCEFLNHQGTQPANQMKQKLEHHQKPETRKPAAGQNCYVIEEANDSNQCEMPQQIELQEKDGVRFSNNSRQNQLSEGYYQNRHSYERPSSNFVDSCYESCDF